MRNYEESSDAVRGCKWGGRIDLERLKTLAQNDVKDILFEFKRELLGILKDKFVELILFGSYARGDHEFDSDIDLLFLLKSKLTEEEDRKISELSLELSLEHDTVITCFDYLYEAYETWETPFLMNVRREGIKV